VPKIVGIEQEYAVALAGQRDFDPVELSFLVVNAYEKATEAIWDYETESPLLDARGFKREGEETVISNRANYRINNLLVNGARLYVDHAHPEFSTAECLSARDVVAFDKAGERIVALAAERASARAPHGAEVRIFKNNTDHKGNSYGTHENYLMDRKVPFARIVQHLMPFFVSRQVFTGSGKVGAENNTEHCDFQISQRADFLETEVGLETMHSRPIINTRDEPHADPEKYRRLHVIVGDANMSEVANYLKCGTMAIVLSMIEDDCIDRDLSLESPVLAYRRVSRDLSCRDTFKLKDGRSFSAVDLQREFLELAHAYYRSREHEPWVDDVLTRWGSVLDRLAADPMTLDRELDWVIKRHIIENYMAKHGLDWADSRVAMIDLQYHDIRPGKGLYYKLEESDAVERLVTEDEVTKAIYDPPKDTRAYFRGMCLQKYADEVVSASWDSVIFDLKEGPLKKIFMLEPLRGTEAHVRQLFAESPTAGDLLRNLGKPSGDF
ncbi:MAG TPA: depupylase/deamidase Dop, partial [Methylomirabilota bacterium]|nr:depupylase/deamidase Dop [Methylomirabilota bacterium]